MHEIFDSLIGNFMEVYINDVIVKSKADEQHLEHLTKTFERMRLYRLKMKLLKCAFGVSIAHFLGFLVHQRGVKVDANKTKTIIKAVLPKSKKELQKLNGQINYLRRFISNTAG